PDLYISEHLQPLSRSPRRIELTPAGQAYFERCLPQVEQARVAHDQLVAMAAQPRGRLRVSMPSSLAQFFLPEVLHDFRVQHPDIECDFDRSMRNIDPLDHRDDALLRFG